MASLVHWATPWSANSVVVRPETFKVEPPTDRPVPSRTVYVVPPRLRLVKPRVVKSKVEVAFSLELNSD